MSMQKSIDGILMKGLSEKTFPLSKLRALFLLVPELPV
jgi:hypothetical protein